MQTKEIKDEIEHLSFSHDGKKILFDRCRSNEGCQIQVYDLEAGELSAYEAPTNERWTMARYSYDGKKMVFSVIPKKDGILDLTQTQIAIMDPDGKNMKKITSGPFPKIFPTFSHSGKKILYAKAAFMREQGRTPAGQYDAWEVDIDTGRETRLTNLEEYSMSYLQYYPDDETFIFQAGEAFKMKKGESSPQRLFPSMPKVNPPKFPLLSKDGTKLVFQKGASSGKFYLYSPDGNHRLVGEGGSVNAAAISPDGELLGIIAANVGIHIYRVQDGIHQWRIYVPTPRSESFDYNRLPKYKTLPEQPLRIINR